LSAAEVWGESICLLLVLKPVGTLKMDRKKTN